MPRKNIFKAKTLTLDSSNDKDYFILSRNNNPCGSRYNIKQAYDLAITILKEQKNQTHIMAYQLEKFTISDQAKVLIENYAHTKNKPIPKLEILADN